jgi:glycine/D-amino acid oxidase-like deaminating enzyme
VVNAGAVVRATEAYTAHIKGQAGKMLAMENYVVATEPISDALWAEIGLADRELFEDTPLMLAYGQRTADGRIVWGGLNAFSRLGSRPPFSRMEHMATVQRLKARLVHRFPILRNVEFTHHWGGAMGVTRDFRIGLGFDPHTGEAWIGGFGGAGVAPTYVAGRTLAELILGVESERTTWPWANHQSPPWEPEPLRWLGVNSRFARYRLADWMQAFRQ